MPTVFTWNDGDPETAVTRARTQVYTAGIGNGYRIQVPADEETRVFRLYLGLWQGRIECVARLSGGHTAEYVDGSILPSPYVHMYTFTYRAEPGEVLTVDITIIRDHGGVNTSFHAATLQ